MRTIWRIKCVAAVATIFFMLMALCVAQPLFQNFQAGTGWAGIRGTTPKGERYCIVMKDIAEAKLFAIRASKLSTQLGFGDRTLATKSQVPSKIEFIVTQEGTRQPMSFVGVAIDAGSGMMILEGAPPPNGPFLGILEKGSALYVRLRDTPLGPYALLGIRESITALRGCLSTL